MKIVVHRRVAWIKASLAFVVSAVTSHAQYIAYDLGLANAGGSIARSINADGLVTGEIYPNDGSPSRVYTYRDGTLTYLSAFDGSGFAPYRINNSGILVGNYFAGRTINHGFIYDHGLITDLGTLGGLTSYAYGISSAGVIIGDSSTASFNLHGFVYKNGVMSDLGTLGGPSSSARAISDNGIIVGGATTSSFSSAVVLWMNGQIENVSALIGGVTFSPFDVNDSGWVAGSRDLATGEHAVLFHDSMLSDLGTLGGLSSDAIAINNFGVVVGSANSADGAIHAFVYQDGQMTDLDPYLATIGLGGHSSMVYDINDSGEMVGFANSHAFLLVPTSAVPEPSTYGITFGCFGLALIVFKRRFCVKISALDSIKLSDESCL